MNDFPGFCYDGWLEPPDEPEDESEGYNDLQDELREEAMMDREYNDEGPW